jgi:hypothetical protein
MSIERRRGGALLMPFRVFFEVVVVLLVVAVAAHWRDGPAERTTRPRVTAQVAPTTTPPTQVTSRPAPPTTTAPPKIVPTPSEGSWKVTSDTYESSGLLTIEPAQSVDVILNGVQDVDDCELADVRQKLEAPPAGIQLDTPVHSNASVYEAVRTNVVLSDSCTNLRAQTLIPALWKVVSVGHGDGTGRDVHLMLTRTVNIRVAHLNSNCARDDASLVVAAAAETLIDTLADARLASQTDPQITANEISRVTSSGNKTCAVSS